MKNRLLDPLRRGRALVGATGLATVLLLAAAPAADAATYTGYLRGTCAQAAGSAYRSQLKIAVTELNVPIVENGKPSGRTVNAATAYMTMNVEWCSDGSKVTYATIAQANADRTATGAASNLERKSYRKDSAKPTAVGGPYTLTTSASWGRNLKGKASASPFGVGGELELSPANFTSTMTVKVFPTDATVQCTGTSGGNAEPCSLNGTG